ncbi:geranylgeranyl diphosphate reductase [Zhengella sp. ZM62]|uniref:geranylgeranyl diphosphate reductase n=1 Tax=Zhengella sedimenti TaxID=3390035 RepID=UPI003974AE06
MNTFDVAVVGGGPCGATAALSLARAGYSVALVDPQNRIKPCGGAIPSRALRDFDIPDSQIVARANAARITGPSGWSVDMQIGDIGFVGMVDREHFDPFLRDRAAAAGVTVVAGKLEALERGRGGRIDLTIESTAKRPRAPVETLTARAVIGADSANSAVRRLAFPKASKPPYVFAYHEIVESPAAGDLPGSHPNRCDVVYDGRISPDFYGWVFPHGAQISVGCGSAVKGHNLRNATGQLRASSGLDACRTIRREGAPLPLRPMRRWDDGDAILLAGDAAGTVAPSSGEGIYYAMLCGELAADAMAERLATGKPGALKQARRRFMRAHGKVFLILWLMQTVWYRNDSRREKFVRMCADPDVQRLTWESYLNKRIVYRDPLAHLRVFARDMQQLLGLAAR